MKRILSLILLSIAVAGCSSMDPRDWSKTEQGAAIGGTGGAVLGGIVGSESGHTGTGAVIGGAAGAGAGGLIGRELDRRDDNDYRRGRYDPYYEERRYNDRYRRY